MVYSGLTFPFVELGVIIIFALEGCEGLNELFRIVLGTK